MGNVLNEPSSSLCVCAIFKDEAPYLQEWVAYHRLVGADHFVLYDNGSTDSGGTLIGNLDYVDVIPWDFRPGQQLAYEHFRINFSKRWEWAAFIDLDEFIYPEATEKITDLLPQYKNVSGVLLNWMVFGSSGHRTMPKGLVIDSYTKRLPETHEMNRAIKSVVRSTDLLNAHAVHHYRLAGPVCDASGRTIENAAIQPQTCHTRMWVNHYRFKSHEEWLGRVEKRRADVPDDQPNAIRPVETIDWVDRAADVTDCRITRFSPAVRLTLETQQKGVL